MVPLALEVVIVHRSLVAGCTRVVVAMLHCLVVDLHCCLGVRRNRLGDNHMEDSHLEVNRN